MLSRNFKIHSLQFGEKQIKVAQVENPELLFDELILKSDNDPDLLDERIPYWADLWPSAIGLAEFLSENSELLKGKQVIEIGCGLGLAGIVAASLGASVLMTDYLQEAIDLAAYNWKLNFKSEINSQLLDWRTPGHILPFDILIASDIAYESRSFKPLLSALKQLVKNDGTIIISEPNRKFAKEFFAELKSAGYIIECVVKDVNKDGINYKITVYILRTRINQPI